MSYKKEDITKILALRTGGLNISEISNHLDMTKPKVMQIIKSQKYKEQSLIFCQDCQEIMDLAFINIANKYTSKLQYLLDNIIDLIENENPRIKIEGVKLLANQINTARDKVMSSRLVEIESKLEKIKSDGY